MHVWVVLSACMCVCISIRIPHVKDIYPTHLFNSVTRSSGSKGSEGGRGARGSAGGGDGGAGS